MILIVDDMPEMRMHLRVILEETGYGPVAEAASTQEAYRYLKLDEPNADPPPVSVVLMDIQLGDGDGIDATCRIKADRRYATLAIIMVTAMEEEEYLNQAFIAGAMDYVMKPAQPVSLVTRVRAALQLRLEAERRTRRETELLAANAALQKALEGAGPGIDLVTGLPDARALQALLARRKEMRRRPALLLLAIDAFPSYVGVLGAEAGTALVAQLAQVVGGVSGKLGYQMAVADAATLAVVVEPPDDALSLAGRVQAALAAANMLHPMSSIANRVTASIAVVGPDALATGGLAPALGAVEDAKRDGGNRIVPVGLHAKP
ncbi:response regulator [Nitrospirillum sp. BR 11164]|uniref:response regulator n=1 Tax=Nitrospirillum sp. BR 11164 TaxID=3104324 RepID=UPI002AFE0D75|nr:response regulator [Nitrospirillum sp. BR 11164]MEA1652375.1 response regulator [Nitrospirillum sp. BR 11164]